MATDIVIHAHGCATGALCAAVGAAFEVFGEVEQQCTRFDPASPLMQANAAGQEWASVPPWCFAAIAAAATAYRRTGGRFDPRVLGDLERLGYDARLVFDGDAGMPGVDGTAARPPLPRAVLAPWQPEFRSDDLAVRIGSHPVDLGGIGKGLAIRWAARLLAAALLRDAVSDEANEAGPSGFLIEAGGDCYAAGRAPDAGEWRIGIEDPFGGTEPLAIVAVRDRAVVTSSTRIRSWRAAGTAVHHIIDPSTGLPGGAGLRAVTVVGRVGDDAADAEVDAKTLFLLGRSGIAAAAERAGLAACWAYDDGGFGSSSAFDEHVVWRRQ